MPAIAYIKTDCEHCDGSIEYPSKLAGQAIECPHCQQTTTLPTPFMPPPPAAPPVPPPQPERPTRQGDEVLFSEAGILVSKTRFVVDSQTFALANISSVRGVETPPSRTAPVLFLLIGFAILAASVWFGIVVIAACIAWMCFQKSKFSVVLTAAGGEVNAYSSYDRAFIGRTIEAVAEAIVARG